jgi:hypothetical protein
MGGNNKEELEKFEPQKLIQTVKERIINTFAGLIPESEWEALVQKEVDAFFAMRKVISNQKTSMSSGYGYNGNKAETTLSLEYESSPFRDLVWEHCALMTIGILKDKITTDFFKNNWNVDDMAVNENIKELVANAAPLAMKKFFEAVMMSQMQEIRQMIGR